MARCEHHPVDKHVYTDAKDDTDRRTTVRPAEALPEVLCRPVEHDEHYGANNESEEEYDRWIGVERARQDLDADHTKDHAGTDVEGERNVLRRQPEDQCE